ncbi:MAG: hypothetical protein ACRD0W_25065, partial [Acidimicrobiales bacterium]
MAAITHAGTTWNTTAGNKTVTATPAVDDLVVVIAASSGLAGGTTAVSDNQSGTYVQVDSDRTGFSTTGVLTVWVREALIPAASSTIFTASQSGSSGGGLTVLRVSGMSRIATDAVMSNGGQSTGTSGTAPAPVLNNTPQSGNPVIGAVCCGTNSTTNFTPRASYTERTDSGYNTPATGLEVMSIDSGETSATITWGSNAPSTFASVAIELDTSTPGGPPLDGTVIEAEAASNAVTTASRDVAASRAVYAFVTHNNSGANTVTSAVTDNSVDIAFSLVRRKNTQAGTTAEVWRGWAATAITGLTVTATGSSGGGTVTHSHIVLAVFSGAEETDGGAQNDASNASGLPSAAVTTTRADSAVWSVKGD